MHSRVTNRARFADRDNPTASPKAPPRDPPQTCAGAPTRHLLRVRDVRVSVQGLQNPYVAIERRIQSSSNARRCERADSVQWRTLRAGPVPVG